MPPWTTDDIPDQTSRTILVTGANSGLGLRSAQALAARGARVLLACRNAEKAAKALAEVAAGATGPAPEVVALDLADLDSVRAAADDVAARVESLDVLMNNAGIMATPKRRTPQGFESQLGTNHLGHFALTGLLLPLLQRAEAPRVISTSSQAHRMGRMRWDDLQWERGYERWRAYGQSKLANLLFMRELARRAPGIISAAAHPGWAATHLQSGEGLAKRLSALGNRVFAQSDAMGALPQLYAATMPDVRSGEYFGPDGMFERAGHPTRVGMTTAARSDEDAARLWDVSEQLTGVRYGR
ncbi:MAG TPA: oxidoreductase [Acidimicrobiales bacterium]|nr:oxidoreductase [Acidimicrobiales bacterium]